MELIRRDYAANGGWETFLSYEDPRQDILVGLLRLRRVSGSAGQAHPSAAAAAGLCCGGSRCNDIEQAPSQPQADLAAGPDVSAHGGSVGLIHQGANLQPIGSRQQVSKNIGSEVASSAAQPRRPAAAHGGRGVGSGAETQPELRGRCSIVRELHVYGTAVAVHARDSQHQQHQVQRNPCHGRLQWCRCRAPRCLLCHACCCVGDGYTSSNIRPHRCDL